MSLAVLMFGYVGVLVGFQSYQQGALTSTWTHEHPVGSIPDATFAPANAAGVSLQIRPHLADGQTVGRLTVPSIGFDAIVTEGDDRGILSYGPGHDDRTGYPGEGRLILIGNHNGFSFSWDGIKPGAEVILEMPYGRYHYTVANRKLVSGDDTTVIGNAPPGEELVLSTCWPLWAGALAQQRLVFTAMPAGGASA